MTVPPPTPRGAGSSAPPPTDWAVRVPGSKPTFLGAQRSVQGAVSHLRALAERAPAADVLDGVAAIRRAARGAASSRAWADAIEARVRIADKPTSVDPLVTRAAQGFDRVRDPIERASGHAYLALVQTYQSRIEAALRSAAAASKLLAGAGAVPPRHAPGESSTIAYLHLVEVFCELDLVELAREHAGALVRSVTSDPTVDRPLTPGLRANATLCLLDVAHHLRVAGLDADASTLCTEAARMLDGLSGDDTTDRTDTPGRSDTGTTDTGTSDTTGTADAADPDGPALATLARGWLHAELGEYDAARGVLEDALRMPVPLTLGYARGLTHLGIGRCAAADHRPQDAVAAIGAAVQEFAGRQYSRWYRNSLYELGLARGEAGQAEAALAALDAHVDARRVLDRAQTRRWAELFQRRAALHDDEPTVRTSSAPTGDVVGRARGEQLLDRLVLRHHRTGAPFSLALIYVEHPTDRINVGGLAAAVLTVCRRNDVISQWAPDELLVLMPGATEEQARVALRRAVRQLGDPGRGDAPVASQVALGIAGMPTYGDRLSLLMTAERELSGATSGAAHVADAAMPGPHGGGHVRLSGRFEAER